MPKRIGPVLLRMSARTLRTKQRDSIFTMSMYPWLQTTETKNLRFLLQPGDWKVSILFLLHRWQIGFKFQLNL